MAYSAKKRIKKKILIIEDERSLYEILKTRLQQAGYQPLVAHNGLSGLKLALEKKPDLILLDIIMPRMDGVTMLRKLRSEPAGKKIPVIILTNLSEGPFLEEAIKENVFDFLLKSDWSLTEIVTRINDTIGT